MRGTRRVQPARAPTRLHRSPRCAAIARGGHPSGDLSGLSSQYSHARARFHSRFTVRGETFSTSAVSSTVSPPKNRSSTIWLFRASTVASAFNASSIATRSVVCCGTMSAFVERDGRSLRRPACRCDDAERDRRACGASTAPKDRRNERDPATRCSPNRSSAGTPH